MLKRQDVHAAIEKNVMGFDLNRIRDDDHNLMDAGLDSLDHAGILLTLEEEHGITFPDDVAGNLLTVGAIVEFANRHAGSE